MNISKLIVLLKQKQEAYEDLEVKITWEGITKDIDNDSIWRGKDGTLYIDADENFYKGTMAVDVHEGE